MKLLSAVFVCLSVCSVAAAQQTTSTEMIHAKCPIVHPELTATPAPADANLNHRGEMGMGFSQIATTHHFLLKSDGGVIQVDANNPADTDSLSSIQMHLHHIVGAFQEGDFDIPMFVYDTVPPGEPEMKRLKDTIHYSIEESATGGRVVIHSDQQTGHRRHPPVPHFPNRRTQDRRPHRAPLAPNGKLARTRSGAGGAVCSCESTATLSPSSVLRPRQACAQVRCAAPRVRDTAAPSPAASIHASRAAPGQTPVRSTRTANHDRAGSATPPRRNRLRR
jgi:hypothetical protein